MKRRIYIVFATLFFLAISSCKKDHSGTMFIVTKGGDNIELGGEQVAIVSEEELVELIEKYHGTDFQQFKTDRIQILYDEHGSSLEYESYFDYSKYPLVHDITRFICANAKSKTLTGPNGEFSLSAREGSYLVAKGARYVGSKPEKYAWITPTGQTDGPEYLSNNQQMGYTDFEALVKKLKTEVRFNFSVKDVDIAIEAGR